MTLVFGFTLVELAVAATATASTVVGFYISYQAFRGLRRHEARSMQYLSIGLILLTAVTYSVALVGTLALRLEVMPLPYQDWFRLVVRLLQLAGLLFIAYSLYSRP